MERPVLDAMVGIVRRDAQLFASYRLRLLAQPFTVLLTLTLFYYVSRLVSVGRFSEPSSYFAYVVVGLLIVETLTAALTVTPVAVRNEMLSGTFERLATSPLGPVRSIVAMCAFPVLLSFGIGTLTIVVAAIVYGLPLAGPQAVLALPVALLGALAFLPFALLTVSAVLAFKQAGAMTSFIVTGLSLASGAFFPVDLLPWWVRWVSDVQPLTPALELMRETLLDTPVDGGAGLAVVKLVGFSLVLMPVGLWLLGRTIDRCRRFGTLIEY